MKIVKPPFTQVVAGVVKSGDPSQGRNPTVQGQLRTTQWIMDGAKKNPSAFPPNNNHFTKFNTNGHYTGVPTVATATLVFDLVAFGELFELSIGNYVLKSGTALVYGSSVDIVGDFLNDGVIPLADVMNNLCDAISRIPSMSATNDGVDTVTITYDKPLDDDIVIAYRNIDPTVATSVFTSISQFSGGSPTVGSVIIT